MDVFNLATPEGESLIQQAITLFKRHPFPSISTIERELRPGYAVSAKIIGELERRGIVSAPYGDGTRRYFGEGAEGREAFKRFAEELRAGIEPASHWWRHLTPSAKRQYMPGVDESAMWGDLSDADRAKLRGRYWRNLDNFRRLQAQFMYSKGLGVAA